MGSCGIPHHPPINGSRVTQSTGAYLYTIWIALWHYYILHCVGYTYILRGRQWKSRCPIRRRLHIRTLHANKLHISRLTTSFAGSSTRTERMTNRRCTHYIILAPLAEDKKTGPPAHRMLYERLTHREFSIEMSKSVFYTRRLWILSAPSGFFHSHFSQRRVDRDF